MGFTLGGSSSTVEQSPSPTFGIDTTYVKYVQTVALTPDSTARLGVVECHVDESSPAAALRISGILPRSVHVHVHRGKGKTMLYAWLLQHEVDSLQDPECAPALYAWLKGCVHTF